MICWRKWRRCQRSSKVLAPAKNFSALLRSRRRSAETPTALAGEPASSSQTWRGTAWVSPRLVWSTSKPNLSSATIFSKENPSRETPLVITCRLWSSWWWSRSWSWFKIWWLPRYLRARYSRNRHLYHPHQLTEKEPARSISNPLAACPIKANFKLSLTSPRSRARWVSSASADALILWVMTTLASSSNLSGPHLSCGRVKRTDLQRFRSVRKSRKTLPTRRLLLRRMPTGSPSFFRKFWRLGSPRFSSTQKSSLPSPAALALSATIFSSMMPFSRRTVEFRRQGTTEISVCFVTFYMIILTDEELSIWWNWWTNSI